MFEEIFCRKKPVPDRLKIYGFKKNCGAYRYETDILDGDFHLEVIVGKDTVPYTRLTESDGGDEYVLYKTSADGMFVGNVRTAIADVLRNIAEHCYVTSVFRSAETVSLINYAREKYGDEPEYLWEKSPGNAVLRRRDTGKWYGVLMTVSRSKLGIPSDDIAEIIDLRCEPEIIEALIDRECFYPGWHMNKRHWYTVILDGSVSTEEIRLRVDASYILAK